MHPGRGPGPRTRYPIKEIFSARRRDRLRVGFGRAIKPTAHMISSEQSTNATLEPNGGYRCAASFQAATLIHDATVWFCEKFLDPRSRPADDMVQAARSGRHYIAKGGLASATSAKTGLRLLHLARTSLEQLLLDYEDYLRHRRLPPWAPDGPEASAVRTLARATFEDRSDRPADHDPTDPGDQVRHARYARWLEHADAAVRANAIICLLHHASLLLDRQIVALEVAGREVGDNGPSRPSDQPHPRTRVPPPRSNPGDQNEPPPVCPKCDAAMVLRTAKGGKSPGSQFWGCTQYPQCKGTAPLA